MIYSNCKNQDIMNGFKTFAPKSKLTRNESYLWKIRLGSAVTLWIQILQSDFICTGFIVSK